MTDICSNKSSLLPLSWHLKHERDVIKIRDQNIYLHNNTYSFYGICLTVPPVRTVQFTLYTITLKPAYENWHFLAIMALYLLSCII